MKKFITIIAAVAMITASCISLSACTSKESYSVSVATVPHGTVYTVQQTAKAGEKVRLACMPEIGYKLTGYTVDGSAIEGNTFVMPDKNVEVSAGFEIVTYSITYIVDGIAVENDNLATYTVDDWGKSLNPPEKDDYDVSDWFYYFAENNWYLDELEDYKVDAITEGTIGDLTLYAHRYNVPHNIITDDNIVNGYIYVYLNEAEAGEEINGWYECDTYYELEYLTVNGVDDKDIVIGTDSFSFVMPHTDVNVSARFRPIEYSIAYDLDGGTIEGDNPVSYNIETGIVLRKPVKNGYTFTGWQCSDSNGNIIAFYEPGISIDAHYLLSYGNLTFQAFYE